MKRKIVLMAVLTVFLVLLLPTTLVTKPATLVRAEKQTSTTSGGYEESTYFTDSLLEAQQQTEGSIPFIDSPLAAQSTTFEESEDPTTYNILQLTDNSYDDEEPQIYGGQVTWYGYDEDDIDICEIFLYDGASILQLTDNDRSEHGPQIHGGQVTWYAYDGNDDEIFLYDYASGTTTQLTDNTYDDRSPQIHGGQVTWRGRVDDDDHEIFLYDGTSITQLTDNNYADWDPQIHDGQVTWEGDVDGNDGEIFLYDYASGTTTQLTDDSDDDYGPQIHEGQVTWESYDGNDGEIFLYDGTSILQLTDNGWPDNSPQIHNGQVTWDSYDGNDHEIFLYDGTSILQLTNNNYEDWGSHIHDGQVTWFGWDGNDDEIFLYDGTSITQLTDNTYNDRHPQIHGGQITWEGWVDDDDLEIFLATPLPPVETTVETTDEHGDIKNSFDLSATVYINGSGYTPSTTYALYIVEDVTEWTDGMDIPSRVAGTETSVTTDSFGNIPLGIVAWSGGLSYGSYDIVIDVNGNSKYNMNIDVLDDEDVEVTAGFSVIPYTIFQLTDNSYDDFAPQIHDGQVTWTGYDGHDYEIFLYNGTDVIQLTDNSYDDFAPQIHDGQVTWTGYDGHDYEIFLYNGTDVIQLTDNSYDGMDLDDWDPRIHDGQVTWEGYDGNDYEIFLYNGTDVIQLTDNSEHDFDPQIHGGQVTWWRHDGNDLEIFLYNGTDVIQLTDNSYDDSFPQIHGGQVTWWGEVDDDDYEIFLYNGTDVIQLTDNDYDDKYPQIHDGQVTWYGKVDGHDYEIFLYNGTDVIQLTDNSYDDWDPEINDGQVTWWGEVDGNDDYEIFLYNGTDVIQLTDNSYDDRYPKIHGGQVTWSGDDGNDDEIFITILLPNTPIGTDVEVTDPITGITVTFDEVTSSGTTRVTASDTGPNPPIGFGVAGHYYDITTTASYTGIISLATPYDETQVIGDEVDLRLMHWNSTFAQWEDVTTGVDIANNIIYGEVTSLSPFAVMEGPDGTPPETTISLTGSLGLDDWYVSDVTVTLWAIDDLLGVAATAYSVDGINWVAYTGPFNIAIEGITTISYNSTDKADNVETTKTTTIKIDKTAPTTTVSDATGTMGLNDWYVSDVTVTLSPTDGVSGSGVAITAYSLDGTTWYTYAGPFDITDEGITTVSYNSTDIAGLVEPTKTTTIKIDKTPPEVTITVPPSDGIVYTGGIWLNGTFDDTMSLVTSITINDTRFVFVEPQGEVPYGATGTFSFMATIIETGEFGVKVTAQNQAGLTETAIRHLVLIPNTPIGTDVEVTDPITGITVTFGETTSSGTTVVTPSDTGPDPPTGFEVAGHYYNITTTASYIGTISIAMPYDDTQVVGDEADLRLMHWNATSAQWEDVTTLPVDTANNIIYGEVTKLSLFAVIEEKPSPPPSDGGGGGGGVSGGGDGGGSGGGGAAPKNLVITTLSEIARTVTPGTNINVTLRITDNSGKAIEGVIVTINVGNVTTHTCEGCGDGVYHGLLDTTNLSPSSYLVVITATKSGYTETSTSFILTVRSPFPSLYIGIFGIIGAGAIIGVIVALKKRAAQQKHDVS